MKTLRFIATDRRNLVRFLRTILGRDITTIFDHETRADLIGGKPFYRYVESRGVEGFDLWIRPDTEQGSQIGVDAEGKPVYETKTRGWQIDIRFRNEQTNIPDILKRRIARAANKMKWKRRKDKALLDLKEIHGVGYIKPATPDYEYKEYEPPKPVPPDQIENPPI